MTATAALDALLYSQPGPEHIWHLSKCIVKGNDNTMEAVIKSLQIPLSLANAATVRLFTRQNVKSMLKNKSRFHKWINRLDQQLNYLDLVAMVMWATIYSVSGEGHLMKNCFVLVCVKNRFCVLVLYWGHSDIWTALEWSLKYNMQQQEKSKMRF